MSKEHLIPWRPGQSGNPLGHHLSIHGFAAQIRRATGNGQQLISFFKDVLEGNPISRPGRKPLIPDLDQRIEAARWLADRGWGRAKEFLEISGETTTAAQRLELLKRLSDDERGQLRALLEKTLRPVHDVPDSAPVLPTSNDGGLGHEASTDPSPSDPSHDTPA
jgi:hypothetical protein